MKRVWCVALAALALAGCQGYSWRSSVPAESRTVAVPTFRNESNLTELGSVAARQVLREFQREGTFRIARLDDAAVEVQGIITGVARAGAGYGDRTTYKRTSAYTLEVIAKVSVIDRRSKRVLVNNRPYRGQADFLTGADLQTAMRDASGRAADDLARQVVDDVLALSW